jgi:uncharacterized membrane protein
VTASSRISTALLVMLLVMGLCWELWIAPLRPGGSWLALKVLPLIVAIPGIAKGQRYTYQWSSMMILVYFIEGVVRAYSEAGVTRILAAAEIVMAVLFFAAAISFVRRQPRQAGGNPLQ